MKAGEFALLQRVAPCCRTVFDVGANVGEWTAQVLTINPAAVVHAFEPVPSTHRQLAARSFPENVVINGFGLSDEAGAHEIYNYGSESELSSLHRREDLEAQNRKLVPQTETIRLSTVDAYAQAHGIETIDFLKIDVEGHELQVLRGAQRMLSEDRIKIIQVEYGTSYILANALLRDVFDCVREHHMTAGRILSDGSVERHDAYHARLEDFSWSNWVFAKPDNSVVWGGAGSAGIAADST